MKVVIGYLESSNMSGRGASMLKSELPWEELAVRLEYLTKIETPTNGYGLSYEHHAELGAMAWQEACADLIAAPTRQDCQRWRPHPKVIWG